MLFILSDTSVFKGYPIEISYVNSSRLHWRVGIHWGQCLCLIKDLSNNEVRGYSNEASGK